MSEYGLKAAAKYGATLKEFHDLPEAENYLLKHKDDLLKKLEAVSEQNSYFLPDYTVESLKRIEKWYFDLYEKDGFHEAGFTQDEFERIMSVYFGEVVVRNNADAKWLIEEYPFSQSKYEFLVNKVFFNMSIMNNYHDLYKKQNNKRKNLLFRKYNKYFS